MRRSFSPLQRLSGGRLLGTMGPEMAGITHFLILNTFFSSILFCNILTYRTPDASGDTASDLAFFIPHDGCIAFSLEPLHLEEVIATIPA